ncbi:MAG: inositol monophosphatase [Halobacteriaceae archaeon]
MTTTEATRFAVAERAARAGGDLAHTRYRTGIDVETKRHKTDVVTQADRDAQERVTEVIHASFPGETVVGEEGDGPVTVPASGPAWVVDPIDGTANYVRNTPTWACSVAAVVDGRTVAAANVMPALGDVFLAGPDGATLGGEPLSVSVRTDPETFAVVPTMYWGRERRAEYAAACRATVERFGDLRRWGCGQAELSMVAAGMIEGALTNVSPNPWDTVAGAKLIREAGGVVTDVHGERWTPDAEGLIASNGTAHGAFLDAAAEIRAAARGGDGRAD